MRRFVRFDPRRRARSRRGLLPVVLLLFPIAVSMYLVAFSRLETAHYAARRNQERAQARLLAESAVAVYRAGAIDPAADAALGVLWEASLAGRGDYRIARLPAASGAERLEFRGIVSAQWGRVAYTVEYVILAEAPPRAEAAAPLRLLDARHELHGEDVEPAEAKQVFFQ